jgi:N,N'-diacetyllegionaminate synthase
MRPIIIAEACQNHNGDREILKRILHQAAENGADYVKIQSIRAKELAPRERFEQGAVGPDGVMVTIKRPYAPELERMRRLELSLDDEAWFVDECLRAGVRSMTTVFTRAAAAEVRDLGFDAVKIASYDCASFPLLRDVRRWWSQVVVSTGATYDAEIERAAAEMRSGPFIFLHCVTIYPTPLHELHLKRMSWLRRFAPQVGLSDHSHVARDGIWASKIALALGADCIERHFTVLGAEDTKDGPVSITPPHLRDLRAFADRPRQERMEIVRREYTGWEQALGRIRRPLSPPELVNRDYYRGRFASKLGDRFVYNWEDDLLLGRDGS